MPIKKNTTALVCLVFFISGCSALIFETLWFRVGSVVLGSSVWSAAAVLTAFMSGLALGNVYMASRGHRIKNPSRFYIGVELAIGISGILAIYCMPKLSTFIGAALAPLLGQSGFLNVSRFCIAFVVLLIPALAMGTTLPLLQKLIHQQHDAFSTSIGRLYGWNTIGAVFGVVTTELFLIKYIGISGSAFTACLLNFIAALLILRSFEKNQLQLAKVPENQQNRLTFSSVKYLLPPFMTGLLLLALEIIWFRYLLLAHDGNSMTFAIMLAEVLCGIGIGGLISARCKFRPDSLELWQILLPVAAAFFTLTAYYLFSVFFNIYFWEITLNNGFFTLASALLILPTSLVSGMLFPLYGETLYRQNSGLTLSSGTVTLVNTIGAALGSGITTFIFLPKFGIEKSIIVLSAVYLCTGIFVYLTRVRHGFFNKTIYITASLAIFMLCTFFAKGSLEKTYQGIAKNSLPAWTLVERLEGLNQTIGYFKADSLGKPRAFKLVTNNHSMSDTNTPNKRYMKFYVYFPYLVHKDIRSVLQISYGVGNTAEAVVRLDTMTDFDLVDLSKEILASSHIVHEHTGIYPLKDKRTRVHVEDGRFFLQTTHNSYDLITAEPPPPKQAGISNLYSKEYFQLIHEKLNSGGMVTYWLPMHSLDDSDARAVIRAFCDVFSDCSLWNGAALDFMLVGSKSGLKPLTDDTFRSGWQSVIADDLAAIGFEAPGQLGSTFLADKQTLDEITWKDAALVDNFPQRISPDINHADPYTPLQAYLLDINRRKWLYQHSAYIRSIFSEQTIATTLAYFDDEEILTRVWVPRYHKDKQNPFSKLNAIADQLAYTDRKFLATLLLNSSPTELAIIKNASGDITQGDDFKIAHIKYLLINRNFKQASTEALHYIEARKKANLDYKEPYRYYLLAMALEGQADKADLPLQHDSFIQWYSERFLAAR